MKPCGEFLDTYGLAKYGGIPRGSYPFRYTWKSPMFMPRWAARTLLEATADARLERLQDLDEGEAMREGVERLELSPRQINLGGELVQVHPLTSSYVDAFKPRWSTLHTKPGERWEDNPEVVALTFTVEQRDTHR
jgi:hypothetical protein